MNNDQIMILFENGSKRFMRVTMKFERKDWNQRISFS